MDKIIKNKYSLGAELFYVSDDYSIESGVVSSMELKDIANVFYRLDYCDYEHPEEFVFSSREDAVAYVPEKKARDKEFAEIGEKIRG